MTFGEYLTLSRERHMMTQSDLAGKIHVSDTVLQNWENNICLPDESFWSLLIDLLDMDKLALLQNYVNDAISQHLSKDIAKDTDGFPSFLFPDEILDKIRKLQLTAEEQELLGLMEIYDLKHLPYDYVRQHGAFTILHLQYSLNKKISWCHEYVVKYIVANCDQIFDIAKFSPQALWEFCACIKEQHSSRSYQDDLKDLATALRYIHEANGSLTIATTAGTDHDTEDIAWQYSDLYSIFWCPAMQKLKYPKYTKMVEYESENSEYQAQKQKCEQDLAYYTEHKDTMSNEPCKPKFQGIRKITMTDTGKLFWEWYSDNIYGKAIPKQTEHGQ